jgi:methionyl-tRNA synthetase
MLSKLPEQDSNLRPPALESLSNGTLTTPYTGKASDFAPDSQADGAKPDAEGATKSQSDYCDRCGKLCWGDAGAAEEPTRSLDGGAVICGECAEELRAGASWAGDE